MGAEIQEGGQAVRYVATYMVKDGKPVWEISRLVATDVPNFGTTYMPTVIGYAQDTVVVDAATGAKTLRFRPVASRLGKFFRKAAPGVIAVGITLFYTDTANASVNDWAHLVAAYAAPGVTLSIDAAAAMVAAAGKAAVKWIEQAPIQNRYDGDIMSPDAGPFTIGGFRRNQ
jgi:hypothetical protein